MAVVERLKQSVISGDADRVLQLTREAIDAALPPQEILNGMVAAMDEIGSRFQAGEVFVPEMLFASRAMKAGLELLEPVLTQAGLVPEITAVVGTVQGDLHDLGKNLVIMMWKGANFDVVDLGIDASPAKFVAAVREHQPQLVGLSALLTTTMPAMKATVQAIKDARLDDVRTMVGGAPVTEKFAREIGADAYADDAVSAVAVARELLAK